MEYITPDFSITFLDGTVINQSPDPGEHGTPIIPW